ncbi:MAG: hypothetical protein DI564_03320 [Rhodanobacter denitrificans]|uniref:Uncharacterized protein n=1 Tax=Rhodanobacter denitrificans TaxID=666685 RepID=A0A2W5KMS1_9GAMM|nr:MAG: hypothetical protein DI564_03320 [Rhodanobacter denitrificans]
MVKHSSFVVLLACVAAPAPAQSVPPEIAAEQVRIDFDSGTYVGTIGNSPMQKLAQSFRLYEAGPISHLMLPLYCNNSWPLPTTASVAIQSLRNGLPSGRTLVRQDVPAHVLFAYPNPATPRDWGMRMLEFTSDWTLTPGDYAFVIEVSDGACDILYGPSGDTYADGEAFYYAPLLWLGSPWRAWGRDLAFQVFQRPL